MPHIVSLCVGKDPVLLETRSKVLRSDGYTVVTARSFKEALQVFVGGDFDLVILCHSIPAAERQAIANAIHEHTPNTPVVLISKGFSGPELSVDAIVASEPKEMLQELPKLLNKRAGITPLERRRTDHE